MTGPRGLPAPVTTQVIDRTDGIPLFIEELTKVVLESGVSHLTWEESPNLAQSRCQEIPATLQDSLMARLDKLNCARHIAQLAAVIGRQFSFDLLQMVSGLDEETLRQGLSQLMLAELVYKKRGDMHAEYSFKHALIQEAACQSLLKAERQTIHARIARALTQAFPEIVKTQPELLAYHLTEAGAFADAITFWQKAGRRQYKRSANEEALAYLSQGLSLLKHVEVNQQRHELELRILTTLGPVYMGAKGYSSIDVERTYARARELCNQLGAAPQLIPVLRGLALYYLNRGDAAQAHVLAEQLVEVALETGDPEHLSRAHITRLQMSFHLGRFAEAVRDLEEAAKYLKAGEIELDSRSVPHLGFFSYGAWTSWFAGLEEQAKQEMDAALDLAEKTAHPFSIAFVRCYAAVLYQWAKDYPRAQSHALIAYELAQSQTLPAALAISGVIKAATSPASPDERTRDVRKAIEYCLSSGSVVGLAYFLAILAEIQLEIGDPNAALDSLAEASAFMDQSQERWWEVEIHRLKGEALAQIAGKTGEAEEALLAARQICETRQAAVFKGRVLLSLARCYFSRGENQRARDCIAQIPSAAEGESQTIETLDFDALLRVSGGTSGVMAYEDDFGTG